LDEEHSLASGFFLVTLFLAEEEKVTGSKGFGSKPSWMMARSVLLAFKKYYMFFPKRMQLLQVSQSHVQNELSGSKQG
jgi:hypothetical protein